ncbi:MAG: hypothetical protein AAGB93_02705 [Planctomycetota bacterium]
MTRRSPASVLLSRASRAAPARAGSARAGLLVVFALVCGGVLALASGALDPLLDRLRARLEGGSAPPTAADSAGEAATTEREATRADATSTDPVRDRPVATIEAASPYDQNERAVAAMDVGDLDAAIALLEEAVAARPDIETFADNLGEAYLRRARGTNTDDPAAALADFDRAIEWTRDEDRRSRITALRDRARVIAETEAEFVVQPTLHFTFKYDGTREEILEGVEQLKILLEDTYQEYGDLFRRRPVEAGEGRIEVVLYRAQGFDAVTGLGDWAGGIFDGTIRVPVANLRDARRLDRIRDVLRHETAHAFAHSIGGSKVPAWLNEGVAQWLEDPAERDRDVLYARAFLGSLEEPLFPLSRITGGLTGWSDTAAIRRAYEQALAFTDYLVRQYGSDLVFEMVAACKEGGAEGASEHFRARILVDLDVVLQDFAASLRD